MDTLSGCPLCSRPRTPADARGLAWSSHHGPSGVGYVCGPCTRSGLADLECGLLDPVRTRPVPPVAQPAEHRAA
ncbi:hypothetical protein [Pseudonocardia sp. HH130630-07]|uniref:hypothetical protein n=1 Tax=Pseudonocardia sp. HH130630-07 TaxID=1690815 RepID=UPI0008150D3E|nr:hypothetical protein [Pseudonocardia sp. HH130630-07]ANY09523.1 hypothetical protein AFB00_28460 [Pseudonocardia sp. HH130630-07]